MPSDVRDMLQWFAHDFGLYKGSRRGIFAGEFTQEHEPVLESTIISLRARGIGSFLVSYDEIAKQAEYFFNESQKQKSFGQVIKTKLELEALACDVLVLKDLKSGYTGKELHYLYHQLLYPRFITGKACIFTTSVSWQAFQAKGLSDFRDTSDALLTFQNLCWFIEATSITVDLFKEQRLAAVPPMLKAEGLLYKAMLGEELPVVAQSALGDYLLDFVVANKTNKLNIECENFPLSSTGDEDQRRLNLLFENKCPVLTITTSEIYKDPKACAQSIKEVWQGKTKRLSVGRLSLPEQNTPEQDDEAVVEPVVTDLLQSEIINSDIGPIAIVGGAGCGKTTLLLKKVQHLIAAGISPEKILVIGFSQEQKQYLKHLLFGVLDTDLVERVALTNWHELGLRIIKENLGAAKRKAPLKIETQPQKIINRLLSKYKKDADPIELELQARLDEFSLALIISVFKTRLISPKQVKQEAKSKAQDLVAKVYQAYEEQLAKANRIDREDMITLACNLLMERDDIRQNYQQRYEYVLCDEYQDVTIAQDMLARILAGPLDNLIVAGDDDETIFESKGANPHLLTDICKCLPNVSTIILPQNYRSHPSIVETSRKILNGLKRRLIAKDMVSAWGQATGNVITGPQEFEDEKAECDWVAAQTQILIDGGKKPEDIAILFRYHRYASLLEDSFSKRGLNCNASHPEQGLVPDEAEDILCFLKLVMDPDGPRAKEAFDRVCQLRLKEVDPKLASAVAGFAEANNLSYLKAVEIYSEVTADQSCRDLEQLVRMIRTMHQENLPPSDTISLLKRTQRLKDYYASVKVPPGVNYEPLRRLNQIEEESRKFATVTEFVRHLSGKKAELSTLVEKIGVTQLLSIHESKGKEFPIVFMVGMAEGLFPVENVADLEEERRLCYVGMTRARELLYLSYPARFRDIALPVSSFLLEAGLAATPSLAIQVKPLNVASPTKAVTREVKEVPFPPSGGKRVAEPAQVEPKPASIAMPSQERSTTPILLPEPPVVPVAQPAASSTIQESSPASQHISAVPATKPAESVKNLEPVMPAVRQQKPTDSAGIETIFHCKTCNVELEPGSRFCGECGEPVPVVQVVSPTTQAQNSIVSSSPAVNIQTITNDTNTSSLASLPLCSLCQAPLEGDAKFCGECGTPVTRTQSGASSQKQNSGQDDWLTKVMKFID
jgi:DNA helicase-2/ATP-dependent DNA helicase PcrA